MAARLTRGKRKIVTAGIPYAVPDAADAAGPARQRGPDRLPRVHRRLRARQRSRPGAHRAGRRGRAARARHPRAVPRRAGAAGPPRARCCSSTRAATPGSTAPAGSSCSPTRTARGGTTTRSPRRSSLLTRMPPHATSALAESYRLQALVAAEHATATTASDTRWDLICEYYDRAGDPQPVTRGAARGRRRPGRAGRPAAPGSPPSTTSTRRCRTAIACRRCAVSCSPGPVRRRGRRGPRRRDRPLRERRGARAPHRRRDELDRSRVENTPRRHGHTACSLLTTGVRRGGRPAGAAGRRRRP